MAVSEFNQFVPRGLAQPGKGEGGVARFDQFITGQNRQGVDNGWDTPFYRTFNEEFQRAQDARQADRYFLNRKTGIAWVDQKGVDDQGSEQVVRAGDVFDNGMKVGNLYDKYGEDTANQVLARFWIDPQELGRISDPKVLNNTVRMRQREAAQDWQGATTRTAFEAQVARQKEEWGDEMNVASPIAGAAGGAITGAGIGAGIGLLLGPGGAAVGAAAGAAVGATVGGVGAWLNRDELEEMAARGEVQARMAEREGTGAGIATRIQAWGGYAGQVMNPLGSLVHGLADDSAVGWGTGGDNKVAFYDVDAKGRPVRNPLWSAADMAGTFVGAVGQFGTGVGAAAFGAQMVSQIAGKSGEMLLTGGKTFDERTGAYDNVFLDRDGNFDLVSGAAGVASIGIDAIQLGMGRGLMKQAANLGRGTAPGLARVSGTKQLFGGSKVEAEMAGMKFYRDASGALQQRIALSALAPSEMVTYLGARTTAMLSRGSLKGGQLTADELFQAATKLTQTSRTMPAALLTGFAEGTEEAVQAVLEPISHNQKVDPHEVLNAFMQGAAAGAGMAVGSRIGTKSLKDRTWAQAEVLAGQMGRPLTRDQWNGMTEQEQRTLLAQPKMAYEAARAAADDLAKEAKTQAVKSVGWLNWLTDRMRAQRAREMANANDAYDRSMVITKAEFGIDDHMLVSSLNTLVDMMRMKVDRAKAMSELPEVKADPALLASVEELGKSTQVILEGVEAAQARFYATGTQAADQEQIVTELNRRLADAWEIRGGDTKMARAVSLMDLRNPVDNPAGFQLLLPQVSLENSRRRAPNSAKGQGDNLLQMTLGPTEGMGADFDGDKATALTSVLLSEDQFASLRMGNNILGTLEGHSILGTPKRHSVMVMKRAWEERQIAVLGAALRDTTSTAAVANTDRLVTKLVSELKARYPFATKTIESFEARLRAGRENAKDMLLQEMYSKHLADVQELALQNLTNEWFWMNSTVHRHLNEFQAQISAAYTPQADQLGGHKFEVIRGETKLTQTLASLAATTTQSVWQQFSGAKIFRKLQSLNYTPYRSAQMDMAKTERDAASWLTQQYLRLSSQMVESKLETLLNKDDVTNRVAAALLSMVEGDEAKLKNGRAALVQMALMEVPNFRIEGGFSKGTSAFVQSLLRESVARERREFSGIATEEQLAKWSLLENATPAEALVHVFESWKVRELLGLDGDVFGGSLTVGQVLARYVNQSTENRRLDIELLRSHPSYLARSKKEGKHNGPYRVDDYTRNETPITAYQVFVDTLEEAGNKTISWNEVAREATGRVAETSARAGEDVRRGLAAMQSRMSQVSKFDMTSATEWQAQLERLPKDMRKFLDLIPEDATFAVASPTESGVEVNAPGWMFELLTKAPEEAEFILFRQTLLASWRQLGPAKRDAEGHIIDGRTPDKMTDRMHILMYRLATDPNQLHYLKFMQMLAQAGSTKEFMAYVNTELRGNEAPYTAWNRDAAAIDPTSVDGAMTASLPGAVQRKAMREFRKQAEERFSKSLSRRIERDAIDEQELLRLADILADPNSPESQRMLRRLQRRMDFNKSFKPPLGPSAIVTSIASVVSGAMKNLTDKGKSASGVAVNGAVNMLNSGHTFATSEERQIDLLTAIDSVDVALNAAWLNGEASLMDENGRPIEWEGLNASNLAEAWKVPSNRLLLASIYCPSVYEHIGEDRIAQRFIGEPTLANLMSDNDALSRALTSDSTHQKHLHAAYLEGVAGHQDVQRFLAAALTYNTSKRTTVLEMDEAGLQSQHALTELVDIVRAAATLAQIKVDPATNPVFNSLTGEQILNATELDRMREQLKAGRREKLLVGRFSSKNAAQSAKLLVQLHAMAMQDVVATAPDTDVAILETAELQKKVEEWIETDILRALLLKFELPKPGNDEAAWLQNTENKRREILAYVNAHGAILASAHWSTAVRKVWDKNTEKDVDGAPILKPKEWEELARVAFVHELQARTTTTSASIDISDAPGLTTEALRYYDPTGNSLLDELLSNDSALIKAELKLREQVDGQFVPSDTLLRDTVNRSFLAPEKMGTWTDAIPVQIQEAHNRIDSSGAPEMIAAGGSLPKNGITAVAATTRNFDYLPLDQHYSKLVVDLGRLGGPDDKPLDFTRPGGASTMPALLLDGRFARSVMVNGVDILAQSGAAAGYLFTGNSKARTSGLRIVTRDRIRLALEEYASRNGMPVDSVQAEIEFLHPDDQPEDPNFANSAYFEGVVADGDVELPSLLSGWWFLSGGVDPDTSAHALQANKKGTVAQRNPRLITRAEAKTAEAGWDTDFGGMLRRKAALLLEEDRLGEGERIRPVFFNAMVKLLKLRSLVRCIDNNGNTVLISAEEMIAAQATKRDLFAEKNLASWELVSLSSRAMRTLLGEQGERGLRRAFAAEAQSTPEQVTKWTGQFTPEQLARLQGLSERSDSGDFSRPALFDTAAIYRDDLIPVSKVTGLDKALLDRHRQGMTFLARRQSEIHARRANERDTTVFDKSVRETVKGLADTFRSSPKLNLLDQRIPTRGRNTELDSWATELTVNRFQEIGESGGLEAGFEYSHLVPAEGRAGHGFSNLYGMGSLEQDNVQLAYHIAPGDVVRVNLDSFGDLEQDLPAVLQRLMNKGARIALSTREGNLRMLTAARHYFHDNNWNEVNGSPLIFELDDPLNTPITQRALYSQLAATRTLDTDSYSLVLQSWLGGLEENAAWRMNPRFGQTAVLGINMLPTSLHSYENRRFSLPTPRQMRELRPRIQAGLDEYKKMTESMRTSGKADAVAVELERAISKAELLQPDGTYQNTDLRLGDIIPLYDESMDRLLLYRHGHKPPTREQLGQMFRTYNGNAIYSPELDSNKLAYEGEIIEFTSSPKYGMLVKLKVPMQAIADKMVFDKSGFKIIPSAVPEPLNLQFPDGVPGVPIDFVIGTSDVDSKSNYRNTVKDFGSAITFLGVDFREELASTLLRGRTDADALNAVDLHLDRLHKLLPKFKIEVIDELIKADRLDATLESALRDILLPDEMASIQGWVDVISSNSPDPAMRITRAVLTYLMYDKSEPAHVMSSSGVASARAAGSKVYARQMPELFTQVFDNTGKNDPLRAYMRGKLNRRFAPATTTADGRMIGFRMLPDFQVEIGNVDPRMSTTGYLQFIDIASAGPNPVLDLLASERTDAQKVSESQSSMAYATLGGLVPSSALDKTSGLFTGTRVSPAGSGDELLETLREVQAGPATGAGYVYTLGERSYLAAARRAMKGFRSILDMNRWTDAEKEAYLQARTVLATRFGLKGRQAEMIDYWVRQHAGRPTEKDSEVGWISQAHAMEHLSRIEKNRRDRMLPTLDAAVPLLHSVDLRQLYLASKKGSGFTLYSGLSSSRIALSDWADWAHAALGVGSTKNEFFDPAFLTPTDGMLHTYLDTGVRFVGLPISADSLRASRLADPDVSEMLLSVSQQRRNRLNDPEVVAVQSNLEDLMGGSLTGLSWNGKYPPASAVAERRDRLWSWRKENKVPQSVATTYDNFLKYGVAFVDEGNRQSAPLRIATNLRAGMALLNPLLYFSAPVEAMIQNTLESAANALTGDAPRGWASRYSPEQKAYYRRVDDALGQNAHLKGMIYSEIALDSHLYNAGRVEVATAWWARFAGRWQDPYYGMKASSVARRYRESVTRAFNNNPALSSITADMVADRLIENPTWVRDNHPAVHQMAMNTIRELRNVKATTMSLAWRGVIEPLSTSPRMLISWPSTLFGKIPFMFAGYGFNKAVQVFGLQGADAAVAAFLNGRKKAAPALWIERVVHTAIGHDPDKVSETYDMSEVIESVDLTTAFVKSGLTHSAMLMAGSMMGELGLSGEDDEDRRRRHAAKLTGAAYLYDPRDIVNDFRNIDALYLDNVPVLDDLFRVVAGDPETGEGGRSMAHMHWIVKQVMSPILGMERFFNTGNYMDILWGFQDAIGSLPLISTMRWDDAAKVYAELTAGAEKEARLGQPETLPAAYSMVLTAVMNLERMLLESSFINSLYVGWDKYDRDPWARPEVVDGKVVTDRMGVPQRSQAMREFQDPETGETRKGYVGRDWYDAQLHALTENRGTMALLGELFTGFTGDFFRGEQVAKVRTFDKQEISTAEGYALIRTIWKGGIDPRMIPGLEGRYLTNETRAEIEAVLRKEVAEESAAMKLNEYAATRRMNEIWYGPRENPDIPGLEDIVWNKNTFQNWIDDKQSTKYYQLNTTYIIGPDGKPWATGISRNLMQTLAGFAPLQGYHTGTVGGMATDASLNAIDEGRGINTGMRALEKIDESFDPRKDDEGVKKPAATTSTSDAGKNGWVDYGNNGWKNYGRSGYRRSYGGSGGGGGGSFTRLQAPQDQQAPYANDVQSINVSNPIIRRASIRRERIESQKGRLKPWQ